MIAKSKRAARLWADLLRWAKAWQLPLPRISAGWRDLPSAWAPLAQDGWIERPILEPPAGDGDEAALIGATGLPVPDDLRTLYSVHEGTFAPVLPLGMGLLPFATMLTTWRSLVALADRSKNQNRYVAGQTHLLAFFNRQWLPIATEDRVRLFLDFAPGPRGHLGQVILQEHGQEGEVVAASTTDFLERWLLLLSEGHARFDSEYGCAMVVGDARLEELLRVRGG